VTARGGNRGKCFRIDRDSLPIGGISPAEAPHMHSDEMGDFERHDAPETSPVTSQEISPADMRALRKQSKDRAKIEELYTVLRPILDEPAFSKARARRISEVAKIHGVSRSSVYSKVALLEQKGLGGLLPPPRPSRLPLCVSKKFDTSWRRAGHDEAELTALGAYLSQNIKDFWMSPCSDAGAPTIILFAETVLDSLCAERGISFPQSAIKVSRSIVMAQQRYRAAYRSTVDVDFDRDRRPRIMRSARGYLPMQLVFVDVRYSRFAIMDEGGIVHPAQIAFHDVATGRMYQTLVKCSGAQKVRACDVTNAFLNMISDPKWGLPSALYMDQGAENNWLVRLGAAAAAHPDARFRNIKAAPFNAPAKPVEGAFATFNRQAECLVPGFPGFKKDRPRRTGSANSSQTVYPGSWVDFCAAMQKVATLFHSLKRQDRPSRADEYRSFLEKGFKPRIADDLLMEGLLGEMGLRSNTKGNFLHGGNHFTDDELYKIPSGEKLEIFATGSTRAPILVNNGRLHRTRPEVRYDFLDGKGRIESSRRFEIYKANRDEMLSATSGQTAISRLVEKCIASRNTPDGINYIVDGETARGQGTRALSVRDRIKKRGEGTPS
jgi:hypothetical protein